MLKLDSEGEYIEAIFDAFIQADFKNQQLDFDTLNIKKEEAPIEKLNSELQKIKREIQEQDDKAQVTFAIKEKMDNELEIEFKKILPDHKDQHEKIKEIQRRALSMQFDGVGLPKLREQKQEVTKARIEDRQVMSQIGAILKKVGRSRDPKQASQMMERALQIYKEKRDVVQTIYEEQNQNQLNAFTQDLTGLSFQEASHLIKKIIKHSQKQLNDCALKPNVGDKSHHILRVIWGQRGLSSGFNRLKIIN